MKILVFGLSLQRGGVESVILNFCTEALDRQVCEFDFVVIDEIPSFAKYLTRYGCRFFVVPNRIKNNRGYKKGLEKILRDNNYDLIWYNACTLSDITLVKLAKDYETRVVLHAHSNSNLGNVFNGVLHRVHKQQIERYVDCCLSCSNEASMFMFPESINEKDDAVIILNNAISLKDLRYSEETRNRLREQYGLSDKQIIGHVGRFSPEKNHERIVQLFEKYYQNNKNVRLVLLGDGELEDGIKRMVKQKGLADAVLFVGSVDNVGEWLSVFDLLLFPSLHEGLPLVVVEAQASGLPCLVSEAIPDKALCSNLIKKIPLKNEDSEWVHELEVLLKDSSEYDRTNAWKDVAQAGFDIAHEAPKLIRLFSEIC